MRFLVTTSRAIAKRVSRSTTRNHCQSMKWHESGLMSHQGVSIEEIARLAGHASTRTTEVVYRRELRPVITTGAEIMDELFTAT